MNKKIYVIIIATVLLLSACSIIIISELPMTDKIQVTFYPYQDKEETFNLESGIVIKQNVNKPSTATITLPDTKRVRDLTINSKVSIDYQDQNLFYGSITTRAYGNDAITFNCQGKLWDLSRTIRSFKQLGAAPGADRTASECFTEAFNDGSTFTYWTPAISTDTYATPFVEGFDATTRVEPVDLNTGETDFFDGQNVTGLSFMKNLATVAKREDNYKYYYYYTRENGVDYLHFEPEGWRGTIPLDVSSFTLKEDIYNLYNNIYIHGKRSNQTIPEDKDLWTEIYTDWIASEVEAGITGSTTFAYVQATVGGAGGIPQEGTSCTRHQTIDTAGAGTYTGTVSFGISRGFRRYDTIKEVSFESWKHDAQGGDTWRVYFVSYPEPAYTKKLAYVDLGGDAADAWTSHSVTDFSAAGGANQFDGMDAGFSFDSYAYMYTSIVVTFNSGTTRNLYLDNFFFDFGPRRSQNTDTTDGYNSTSAAEYGLRETTLKFNWLKTITDCNTVAANLLAYHDSPHYQSSGTINGFQYFKLNSKIAGTYKGIPLELPVIGITYTFNAGQYTTQLTLGSQREKLEDILKKYSSEIDNEGYDRGTDFYLF